MSALARISGCLIAVMTAGSIIHAHTPVEFLEVSAGKPASLVEHTVTLQSAFDEAKVETMLSGPHHFSQAVGCLDRPAKEPIAYLNWYQIVGGKKEATRRVSVLDFMRGADNTELTIESAEYLLSPAQRITTGAPSDIPEGLDYYKAYKIVDAAALNRTVEVTDSAGGTKRQLGKPLLLCVPTKEWHHDEFFDASHDRACLVVYGLDTREQQQKFSTIDQFGLNQLQATKSQWLCVRGSLLTK